MTKEGLGDTPSVAARALPSTRAFSDMLFQLIKLQSRQAQRQEAILGAFAARCKGGAQIEPEVFDGISSNYDTWLDHYEYAREKHS